MIAILVRNLVSVLVASLLILVYSHSTVVVSDEEWQVCTATGRCDFHTDRFLTPEEADYLSEYAV